ncbi:MAG: hypothetical protein FWG73_03845 [Planctomycetaceae bacterium]|nr:hypothetical protein [Planctomycetaceae bacterium]
MMEADAVESESSEAGGEFFGLLFFGKICGKAEICPPNSESPLFVMEGTVFGVDESVFPGGCVVPISDVRDIIRGVVRNNEGKEGRKFVFGTGCGWPNEQGKEKRQVSHFGAFQRRQDVPIVQNLRQRIKYGKRLVLSLRIG